MQTKTGFQARMEPEKNLIGRIAQMNCNGKANESIKCTVQQCAHHCGNSDYCTLGTVSIGTHEMNPTMVECTDCNSFQLKK